MPKSWVRSSAAAVCWGAAVGIFPSPSGAQGLCPDGSPRYFGQCPVQQEQGAEVEHRLRQVDAAVKTALERSTQLRQHFASSTGEDVRDFGDAVAIVAVSVRLSGIVGLPAGAGSDRTVWLGYSGFGVRHLVDQAGYKLPAYANSSLADVLPGDAALKMSARLEAIEATFPQDALKKLHNSHVAPSARDYEEPVAALAGWLTQFSAAWEATKGDVRLAVAKESSRRKR